MCVVVCDGLSVFELIPSSWHWSQLLSLSPSVPFPASAMALSSRSYAVLETGLEQQRDVAVGVGLGPGA